MHQPVIQFWAPVDGNGAAASNSDGLHQTCVGGGHSSDFSKGIEPLPEPLVNQ